MQAEQNAASRQFGLDWLRIGAFGLLILYHIGMFFVPWGWHVKADQTAEWLEWPMMAINPWRLMLLFVISGIVSRSLLLKLGSGGAFASVRSIRLLVPLLFGMLVIVAPQPWFELSAQGQYSQSLLHFWWNDYFEFGAGRGTPLPTWNHLWFIVYLWFYSIILAVLACLSPGARLGLQHAFDGLFAGGRLVTLPICGLFAARWLMFPAFGETHALVDDPYAHVVYGFAFFFGVGLAKSGPAWTTIQRYWRPLLMLALLACPIMFAAHAAKEVMADAAAIGVLARSILGWTAILGLLGFSVAYLHFDNPVRRYLTEAIFPYYIVHQSIIIAAGFYLNQGQIGGLPAFGVIFLGTLLGCGFSYELVRRINWLRPLFGLKAASWPLAGGATPPQLSNGGR